MDYSNEIELVMTILSVVNAALEQTSFEANPDPYIVSGVAMLLCQLYGDLEQALNADQAEEESEAV